MKQQKISIILLNHNGLHFLQKCIPTILKQTYKNIEIIVTDNHSTDGSVEYVKKNPRITLIQNKDNYGYSKANNIAAQLAKGDFLFFLNNDTELLPTTIQKLIEQSEEKTILTAHQIPTWDKKALGSSGAGMDIFGYPYVIDDIKNMKVFYADGAMIFIKRSDFLKLGMFDEALFIFQEDIDLSWRAQIFGYKIKSCWNANLYHYGGGTVLGGNTGKNKSSRYTSSYLRRYLNEKNIIRNILKNYSYPLGLVILLFLLLLHSVELLALGILLKWKVIKCYLQAYWWNFIHLQETLRVHKNIQQYRVVSDWELMKRMYWSYSKINALIKVGVPQFK